jgi:lantibiotic leader peptide-processing serine protease
MRRIRVAAGASLGALALVTSSLSAGAMPAGSGGGAATARATSAGQAAQAAQAGGGEFVVSYKGDVGAATKAITGAGGQVASVNQGLHIALVETSNANFLNQAKATDAIVNGARNHSVGFSRLGMQHRFSEERPALAERAAHKASGTGSGATSGKKASKAEPLADKQWDMDLMGANADGAHRKATGKGVTVGIIDTGVDASHPDIAPHFNKALSRNWTMDIPDVDGPCEVATCIDPVDTDQGGHGTHVSGIVGAARNGIGTAGVAPDVTIVNDRAGQDSGFFFLFETVAALTYAGDAQLDVVNMSFFTDPWLYNCTAQGDVISGPSTDEQIAEQAFIRQTVEAATTYAHDHGVTLVAAAGNEHTDLAAPTRNDAISPDFPLETEVTRVVSNNCLDMPAEAPHVIAVSSVGPSTTKADYSTYGLGKISLAAPGGYFRDNFGTPSFMTPGNLVLSSYPLATAIEEGLVDADGNPTDDFSFKSCDKNGNNCGIYTYLQGTSMASPHVAGEAALIIQRFGKGNAHKGFSLDPDRVQQILEQSATDHACPAGGVQDYTNTGRPAEFNAICAGTTADNGLYGEGIANAAAAVGATH